MKTNKKKIKCFSWKNIPLTVKAYPKTSCFFCILMLFTLWFCKYDFIMAPFFVNYLVFILLIIFCIPAYILVYVLKKYGKSFFLRLFWFYFIIIAIFLLLSLAKKSFWSTYMFLMPILFCEGIIFFLGTNTLPQKPQNKTPWITIFFIIPFAFICFIAVSFLVTVYLRFTINLLQSKISDLTDSRTSRLMDCACVINRDYTTVVSEDGHRLKCKGLSRCSCGRYYGTCNNKNGKPYTGYAVYKQSIKLVRKVYYENGEVNPNFLESYYNNGKIEKRRFMQDDKIIYEDYSEDGEMVEQSIRKNNKQKLWNRYVVYSKQDNIVGHKDKEGYVKGLYDKTIGRVGPIAFLACDANENYIGYAYTHKRNDIKFKDFDGNLLGQYTEDKSQIITENGKIIGKPCSDGRIAYDSAYHIIGIVIKEDQRTKEGDVLGINYEKKVSGFAFDI